MAKRKTKTYRIEVNYDGEWQRIGRIDASSSTDALTRAKKSGKKDFSFPRGTKWRVAPIRKNPAKKRKAKKKASKRARAKSTTVTTMTTTKTTRTTRSSNPSRKIKIGSSSDPKTMEVEIKTDITGAVHVSPVSAKIRRNIEQHLAMFGESDADLYFEDWRGDEWLDQNLSKKNAAHVRAGYTLTAWTAPYDYGMWRGWDLSEFDFTAENPEPNPLRLGKQDKAVIRAFTEQRAADGHKLVTDGHRIDGYWQGGSNIAYWRDDKIHFSDVGSKAAETVQNAIKREAPKNDLYNGRGYNPFEKYDYVFRDGNTWVVVQLGMPEDPVKIGVGSSYQAAIKDLAPTAIQSAGRRDEAVQRALRWAHGQGWVSAPDDLVFPESFDADDLSRNPGDLIRVPSSALRPGMIVKAPDVVYDAMEKEHSFARAWGPGAPVPDRLLVERWDDEEGTSKLTAITKSGKKGAYIDLNTNDYPEIWFVEADSIDDLDDAAREQGIYPADYANNPAGGNPFEKIATDSKHPTDARLLAIAFVSAHNSDEVYPIARAFDRERRVRGGQLGSWLDGTHFTRWHSGHQGWQGDGFNEIQEYAHEYLDRQPNPRRRKARGRKRNPTIGYFSEVTLREGVILDESNEDLLLLAQLAVAEADELARNPVTQADVDRFHDEYERAAKKADRAIESGKGAVDEINAEVDKAWRAYEAARQAYQENNPSRRNNPAPARQKNPSPRATSMGRRITGV